MRKKSLRLKKLSSGRFLKNWKKFWENIFLVGKKKHFSVKDTKIFQNFKKINYRRRHSLIEVQIFPSWLICFIHFLSKVTHRCFFLKLRLFTPNGFQNIFLFYAFAKSWFWPKWVLSIPTPKMHFWGFSIIKSSLNFCPLVGIYASKVELEQAVRRNWKSEKSKMTLFKSEKFNFLWALKIW